MNAPSDTHVIQKRDLIEMLERFPDWSHVTVNLPNGVGYIDKCHSRNGRIEIEVLHDSKPGEVEELQSDLDAANSECAKQERDIEELKSLVIALLLSDKAIADTKQWRAMSEELQQDILSDLP